MRSLFRSREEVPAPVTNYLPPVAEEVSDAQTVAPVESSETVAAQTVAPIVKRKHQKRERTVAEQILRRRRIALGTLCASLALGGRWFVAHQTPTYPVGEGVYQTSIAPKWGQMKQPNAATFYMAATDALDLNAINQSVRGVKHGTAFLMDAPITVQKAPVALAQPALNLLRQGMQYPYLPNGQTNFVKSDPNTGRGLNRPVVNFIALREMARLLAADASVRASEGNTVGAMESSLDAVRLGVDAAQGHTLTDGMIGVLLQGIGTTEAMKHIAGLSAAEARAATTRLQSIMERERTAAQIFTAERDSVYEIFQTTFSAGNAQSISGEFGVSSAASLAAYNTVLMFYTKQGLVNDYAAHTDAVLRRVKLPYQQAKQLPKIAESKNPVVAMLAPNYERAFTSITQKRTRNRVLLAQLAVQAYKGEHKGVAPATLAEL
ncbi:MAG: hypothetical protein H7Y38_16595, partial [Armatimonadetes bacterium]|nr:hypothetical protein [Armatimonadota bacterium]